MPLYVTLDFFWHVKATFKLLRSASMKNFLIQQVESSAFFMQFYVKKKVTFEL